MDHSEHLQLAPPTFYGRQLEIEQIVHIATGSFDSQKSRVVLIEGPGGIGKSMLIRQTAKQLQETHPEIRCVGPFDMDDTDYRLVTNTSMSIATILGEKHFAQYIEANRKQQGKETSKLDRSTVLIHLALSDKYFVTDYQRFAKQNRVVILADTIEAIRGTHVWSHFVRMIALLPNTVFVLAGRPEGQRESRYPSLSTEAARFQRMSHIGDDGVEIIKLKGWSKREARAFIRQTEGGKKFAKADVENLLHLSRCQPLHLTLAVENMQRIPILEPTEPGVDLEIIPFTPLYHVGHNPEVNVDETLPPDVDFTELPEKGQELVLEFERQLLLHMTSNTPIARVMRRMAHLRRRLNEAMYRQIITFQPAIEGAPGWEAIGRQPWIRHRAGEFITLHDIVGELLRKHVWPRRDGSGNKRRQLSQQVIGLYATQIQTLQANIQKLNQEYDQQLDKLNQQLSISLPVEATEGFPELTDLHLRILDLSRRLWVLEAEQLYYELDADVHAGYKAFIQTFDAAGQQGQFGVREMLLHETEGFLSEFASGTEEYYQIVVREIAAARDGNLLEKAAELAEHLREVYTQSERQYRLLMTQGNIYLRTPGRENAGLAAFQAARNLTKTDETLAHLEGETLLELGWAYRQLGRWQDATRTYREALDMTPLRDRYRRAQINNGLAYVEVLIGEYDAAESFINSALGFRRLQTNQTLLGISLSVQGEVLRYQEKYAEAHQAYDEAMAIFTSFENTEWLGIVQQEKAICLLQEHGSDNLEDALHYIESACYLCREYNPRAYPSALNRAGRIYSKKGDYERAFTLFREGIDAAQMVQDIWFLMSNCIEYAELAYRLWHDTGNSEFKSQIFTYENIIAEKEQGKDYAFADLFGRWHLVKGHTAWYEGIQAVANGDADMAAQSWEDALQQYAKGFPKIAQGYYGSHGIRALPREGQILRQHTKQLPVAEAERWCEYLDEIWNKPEMPPYLTGMVEDMYSDLGK